MAIKATKKSINQTFRRVYSIPYCGIQYLTCDVAPMAYTSGVYGWNADIYAIGSTALVTGYRPFGKQIAKEVVDRFESKAKQLVHDRRYSELSELRNEFIQSL